MLSSKPRLHGFFYRIGLNINNPNSSKPPHFEEIEPGLLVWSFADRAGKKGVWYYPNNNDFTLYRKEQIKPPLTKSYYSNPNQHECHWCNYFPKETMGACFTQSKIVNYPMNRVNETIDNYFLGPYSIEELNEFFLDGKKFDVMYFKQSQVFMTHQKVDFRFIDR